MPGQLNEVKKDLIEIKNAAEQAKLNLAGLRAEFERLATAAARGGTPTTAGIQRFTEQSLSGTGTVQERGRVGGGARVSSAYQEELRILQEHYRTTQKILQVRQELMRTASVNYYTENPPVGTAWRQKFLTEQAQIKSQASQARLEEARARSVPMQYYKTGSTSNFEEQYKQQVAEAQELIRNRVKQKTAAQEAVQAEAASNAAWRKNVSDRAKDEHDAYKEAQRIAGAGAYGTIDPKAREAAREKAKAQQESSKAAREEAQAKKQTVNSDQEAANLEEKIAEGRRKGAEAGYAQTKQGKAEASKQKREEERAAAEAAKMAVERAKREQMMKGSPKVYEKAQEFGFTIDNSTIKSYTDASTGITRYAFAMELADGTMKKLNITQDKYGRVLVDTQKRFRSFGDAIMRDVGEFLKWSIAIMIVYAPLQKLSELVQISIKNETELANIAVVLGKRVGDMGSVFRDAAQAAQLTGEHLDGVLEGYTLAYRATGRYTDETKRAVVTQKLLTDSLILSKLSGMEQAAALDTISGGLNQMGMGLDQGTTLLDKWVKVTRIANVDLQTLAESFAITSTSASNAGLSIDQINGIIATVAETTTLSATEAGNAVRAFVSGFQTDTAKRTLGNFGIAVEDSMGQARGFMDIMQEIKGLFDAGLISDAQLNKIGEALGGGVRRGAQYVAFLKNLDRVQQVAAQSADSEGAAQSAMATKLETTQTAVVMLGNAFQKLAQTMGGEGGTLNVFKLGLDILTRLVELLDKTTKSLGGMTIPLAALAGGFAYMNSTGRGSMAIFNAAQKYAPGMVGRATMGIQRETGLAQTSVAMGNTLTRMFTERAQYIGGLLAIGFSAYMKAREGDWTGVAGTAIGGAIGAYLGGPMGMVIGATIGQAAADILFKESTDWANITSRNYVGAGVYGSTTAPAGTGANKIPRSQQLRTEALKQAYQMILPGQAQAQSIVTGKAVEESALQLASQIGLSPTAAPEVKKQWADIQKKLLEAVAAQTEEQTKTSPFDLNAVGPQAEQRKKLATQYSGLADQAIATQLARINKELIEGTRSGKEFSDAFVTLTTGAPVKLHTIMAALGEDIKTMGPGFENAANSYQTLARYLIDMTPEAINQITALIGEIADLQNQLNTTSNDVGTSRGGIIGQMGQKQSLLKGMIQGFGNTQRKAALQEPSLVDYRDYSDTDIQKIIGRARKYQEARHADMVKNFGYTPADIAERTAAYNAIEIAADGHFQKLIGLDEQYLQQAESDLEREKAINKQRQEAFSIESMPDVERGAFLSQYARTKSFIQSNFPQYKLDEKEMGVIFKNNVTDVLHLDNLIMQLSMQELIDVSKKQLDGIYNLPSGGSFYVPFQGYKMGFVNQQAGGGGGGFPAGGGAGKAETAAKAQEMNWRWAYERPAVGAKGTQTTLPDTVLGQAARVAEMAKKSVSAATSVLTTLPDTMAGQASRGGVTAAQSIGSELTKAVQNLAIDTKLELRVDSQVQLLVDGKVLAEAIRPYFYDELLKQSAATPVTTKVVVL